VTEYMVYKNPVLTDYLQVLPNLCADEVEQYEAFTGETFDPEKVAAIYSLHQGPRWVYTADGSPIVIAGFDEIRRGVWQDWLFSVPQAWGPLHWKRVTRESKRTMTVMLQTVAHRLQCVSLASRLDAHRWYGALGLELEGRLARYGASGQDALIFSRVRPS
jgi:hypothetical protein